MTVFIRSEKDPEGKQVRVERGFRGADGKSYLLLHRLPPEYAKPPTFLVELSGDRVDVRGEATDAPVYHKAYAFQCFTAMETKFLRSTKAGSSVSPFFNFSYPNVLRVLGKQFACLSEDETAALARRSPWKLVGGQR